MKYIIYIVTLAALVFVSTANSQEMSFDALFSGAKVKNDISGLSYPEPDRTDFLKEVLLALGVSYAIKIEAGKTTVFWVSTNPQQEQEVQDRVSQYIFVKEACPVLKLPLPSDPAKTKLKCEQ